MANVRLENITKSFQKGSNTIQNIKLSVTDGEFLVLVGPSGCGKSTTLRMIAGLEEPTTGKIFIGDRDVTELEPKDRDIAMVFQNYALYPHMNVYENMAFGLKLRKFSKADIQSRVQETAQILEIEDLLKRKPKELSGGQRQRVALGRAIVRKPNVFLFDEPLSNLDAKLRVQMRTEIKKLHLRLGTTMIYVTHDQVEAMTMGDRIVVMKSGIIHQIDTPLALYNRPADLFVAGFIGSPGMNFIQAALLDHPLRAEAGSISIPLPEAAGKKLEPFRGKNITIGIRPEHIYLSPNGLRASCPVALRHEVSELMGNEMYLYTASESTSIICRSTSVERTFAPGENIQLYFDLEKMHLFDPETELVLS